MIIILSYDADRSTNKLIDWLKYLDCPFERVNLEIEDFRNLEYNFESNQISVKLKLQSGEILDFSNCAYFYNRGRKFKELKIENESQLPDFIFDKYILNEFTSIVNFFYELINKKSIGSFYTQSHSKLNQLKLAQDVLLDIPKSILVQNNSLSNEFKYHPIITKAVQDNIAIRHEGVLFIQRVQMVDLESMEDLFYPSFFQIEIKKAFEIRSFYLDGTFYSIQYYSDSKKIDMRDNYNSSIFEPFELPEFIEKKLREIMLKLRLNSGSIDLIKSTDGKYYFLEINPNGQYDWVSQYGGYDLDEKIAQFLKSKC